jgi:hypothetical protein
MGEVCPKSKRNGRSKLVHELAELADGIDR